MSSNISNVSIRFQIIGGEDNENVRNVNRVPSIFDENTSIEISGGSFHNPFVSFLEHLNNNIEPTNNPPRSFFGGMFDLITEFFPLEHTDRTEFPMDNLFTQFVNMTLNQEQPQPETATEEMIRELGSYRRIKDNDKLLEEECSICTSKYQKNEGIRELPCKHYFHKRCVDKWLKTGGLSCPYCRKNPFENKTNEINETN